MCGRGPGPGRRRRDQARERLHSAPRFLRILLWKGYRADIRLIQPADFSEDGNGVGEVASRTAKQLFLGKVRLASVSRVEATAEEHGMPLLVRLAKRRVTPYMCHPGHRSVSASWAVVLCDVVPLGGATVVQHERAGGQRRRRGQVIILRL